MAHREYYNKEGKQVPSVTTIVKLLDKENIASWHNWMGLVRRINTTTYLEQKAEYGNYCHTLFEMYFTGMVTTSQRDERFVTEAQFHTLLEKFHWLRELFARNGITVQNMELGMDGERFGGTLDMLATHEESHRIFLLDLKTSKQVYPSHFLQLAGYTLLLKELFSLSVTDVGIIVLSQPVEHMVQLVRREDNSYNEQIFLKLLDIYHIQQERDGVIV